jgi:hypothetical protein
MSTEDEKILLIEEQHETDPEAKRSEPPELSDELVDQLLAGSRSASEITGQGGLLQTLTKRLIERAMDAELTEHLGYERGEAPPGAGNSRNGSSPKTLRTEHGSVRIEQPRDRHGDFEPQILAKHQRRFDGFDEKIIAMCSRGMSVRDIQAHLAEIYGVQVGHDLISRVTDAVLEDVKAWQSRPLEDLYRSSTSTRWWSRSATAEPCGARPATWRWASTSMASATCSGSGFRPQRARSSG